MMSFRSRLPSLVRAACSGVCTKRNLLVGGVATAAAAAAAYSYTESPTLNVERLMPTTYISHAKDEAVEVETDPTGEPVLRDLRQIRFHQFASIEYKGQFYMTALDFLDSVTDFEMKEHFGKRVVTDAEVNDAISRTPSQEDNSTHFFRSLQDKGLISYTEYLFLLSILTKPRSGFKIAFNMFDTDGNRQVDRKEFLVLKDIFRKRAGGKTVLTSQYIQGASSKDRETTLLRHFFGEDGKSVLNFDDFFRFMDNLQTEVLEIEFLRYSGGKDSITYQDFAKSLLRFTSITEINDCLQQLDERITDKQPITFSEFRSFYYFLNNLEDFAIAMQLYALAGRSVGQGEFKRAVKVSTGEDLSDHLISTVYHLFDKDGDNKLSYVEFIGVMKDRIQRGFRQKRGAKFDSFRKCISKVLHNSS